MTAKEKAKELFDKFYQEAPYQEIEFYSNDVMARQCALKAVEEILNEYQSMSDLESILVINNKPTFVVHQLVYWQEVKQEIEKL
jgi:hypothetical protein